MKVGSLISHDFSGEIPELKKINPYPVSEDMPAYSLTQQDDLAWKDKYIVLLENFNRFMQKKQDSNQVLAAAISELSKEFRKIFLLKNK